MSQDKFFKDSQLSFLEARYTISGETNFKPHMHKTFSIGAVDSGAVKYIVGTDEAELRPGALAVINPEILHSCNSIQGKKRSYYMLYLDVDWCKKVQNSTWQTNTFLPAQHIHIEEQLIYHDYCEIMNALFNDSVHLQEKEQLVFDIVCRVFQFVCNKENVISPKQGDVALLKELLAQDLQKDTPLNDMADVLNCNPYTLLRQFKAHTGITPHAYRMNCRIDKAKRLLQEGNDIVDVAFECGFFDQSHFHRYFKAMTATTPQKYRVNFIQ